MKNLFTFLLIAVFCTSQVIAEEITDVTPDNFVEKWGAANDGDVLILTAGTYESPFTLQENKTITIKANDGVNAIVKAQLTDVDGTSVKGGPVISPESVNSGLICDGLTLEFIAQFVYLGQDVAINTLQFKNCTIQASGNSDAGANLVCLQSGTVEEIIIDGCIVKNSSDGGKNFFIYTKNSTAKKIEVRNSTFYNLDFRGLYTQESDVAVPVSVVFESNTVYNWTNLNDYLINFYRGTSDAVFTLKNNIYVVEPAISKSIFRTRAGVYTYNNNLTIGYDPYATSGTLGEGSLDLDASALGFSSIADINFADAANGDFTLPENSPLLTAGVDNGPVGDPRWAKAGTGINSIQIEETPYCGNIYSIDGRIVRQNVENSSNIAEGLDRGLYIYNGKKFIVK